MKVYKQLHAEKATKIPFSTSANSEIGITIFAALNLNF